MKKIILNSIAIFGFTLIGLCQDGISIKVTASGQGIITPTGDNTDYSSGHSPYVITTSDNSSMVDIVFNVENSTGSARSWRLTRQNQLDVPSDWSTTACLGQSCFGSSTTNPWCSPANSGQNVNTLDVASGTSGEMSFHITIGTTSTATYKLYLGDCNNFDDSISVQINYTAGVKEVNPAPRFSLFPNPSNESVSIQLNNSKNGYVKIVDLVGNIIYSEAITASTKLNVADFKNGIYFVTIEAEGVKLTSKKLVVKH